MKYFRASGISEAVEAIASGAKPLAGGTVIVPNLASSGGRGQTIVDIGHIPELAQTRIFGGSLVYGSMVPLASIAANSAGQGGIHAVVQAAGAVGNPHVRRAATIGGNVALGIGTADMVPALLALDAKVVCVSDGSVQTVPLENFDPAGRLITSITIPVQEQRRSAFRKFAWRGASGITIVSVAVALSVSNGLVSGSRVVAGGLTQHPQRLSAAETSLEGQPLTSELAAGAAATAAHEAVCQLSGPPGEAYRRRILEFCIRDNLIQLMKS